MLEILDVKRNRTSLIEFGNLGTKRPIAVAGLTMVNAKTSGVIIQLLINVADSEANATRRRIRRAT